MPAGSRLAGPGHESETMALNPDQIENKQFVVGLRGFDKDEVQSFLELVANDYRKALDRANERGHAQAEGATTGAAGEARAKRIIDDAEVQAKRILADAEARAKATAAATPAAATTTSPAEDPFARMGEQVAALMRSAEEQAAVVRAKAGEEAGEIKRDAAAQANLAMVEADKYAADLKSSAESSSEARRAEADADRTEAKRSLTQAQQEALTLVADATNRAQRMLEATERKAREQAERVLSTARQDHQELVRNRTESQQRLQEASEHLTRALAAVSTDEPVSIPDAEVVDPDETVTGAGTPHNATPGTTTADDRKATPPADNSKATGATRGPDDAKATGAASSGGDSTSGDAGNPSARGRADGDPKAATNGSPPPSDRSQRSGA